MTIQTYRPTLNAGQVYMRVAGSAAPMLAIGNVSALTLAISEEEKVLQDFTTPGGGQWAAVSRISGIEASMTLHDLDPVNLARAVYGGQIEEAAASVTDEAHSAYQRGLIRLDHVNPTSVTLAFAGAASWSAAAVRALGDWLKNGTHVYRCTVAGTSHASVEPTWPTDGSTVVDGTATWIDEGVLAMVADTDYEVRPEGIMILEAGIPDGCPLTIDYSYAVYDAVEGLTVGSQVYEMSFAGLNEANSNSSTVLDIFRLQLGAAAEISWIGDDFSELAIKGKVMLDPSKSGAGISRYFKTSLAR